MSMNFENHVRCSNCNKVFHENEVIYDGDEDMEFCPHCGEGGCIKAVKVCKTCGRIINEDEELVCTVNHGLEDEYVQCESCHDADWEENKIVICEACGEWVTPDKLHDEKLTDTYSFTPCPICGKDVVDGCSREDALEELAEEMHLEKFSVIIHWANGGSRGYVIAAKDANEMMKKLMERVDLRLLQAISYSPILIDEDVMI